MRSLLLYLFQLYLVEFMVLPEGKGSTGLYQYFIKVVPTVYTDESRRKHHTNQYTFTERFRPLMLPDAESGLLTEVRTHCTIHRTPIHHFRLILLSFLFSFSFFILNCSNKRLCCQESSSCTTCLPSCLKYIARTCHCCTSLRRC